MMKKVTHVGVTYEDGSVEHFYGKGTLRKTQTTVTREFWKGDKLDKESSDVTFYTIGITPEEPKD